MIKKSLRAWLGLDREDTTENAPLRDILDALDHLPPDRARYLAAFAYLLGRVAGADQHVSPEETRAMETLVSEHGGIPHEQAMLVVQLAKTSNLLFGGTANFLVARDFSASSVASSIRRSRRSMVSLTTGGRSSGNTPPEPVCNRRLVRSTSRTPARP